MIKNQLKKLVEQNNLSEVFDLLTENLIDSDSNSSVLHLKARYNNLQSKRNKVNIDFETYRIELMRISDHILYLISNIEFNESTEVERYEQLKSRLIGAYSNYSYELALLRMSPSSFYLDKVTEVDSKANYKEAEKELTNLEEEFFQGIKFIEKNDGNLLVSYLSKARLSDGFNEEIEYKEATRIIKAILIQNFHKVLEVSSLPLIEKMLSSIGLSIDDVIPDSKEKDELVVKFESRGKKIKILFLGANPDDTTRLRLDEEVKEIDINLRLAKLRDELELIQKWAVTPDSLMQAILDYSPDIIHFSGHGNIDGIFIEDKNGNHKLITNDTISSLFELADSVKCVVLNSCYSKAQGKAIKNYTPFVIGMKKSVPDTTAIKFSIGFYKAIGAGKDFESAYKHGIVMIKLEGLSGDDIPEII